jgi:hypothetical protein
MAEVRLGRGRGEGLGAAGIDRVRTGAVGADHGADHAGAIDDRRGDVEVLGGAGRDGGGASSSRSRPGCCANLQNLCLRRSRQHQMAADMMGISLVIVSSPKSLGAVLGHSLRVRK